MKLPLSIALALQQMLDGAQLPSSTMRHPVTERLLEDGLLHAHRLGRTKTAYSLINKAALPAYLQNHFGIADLSLYIEKYSSPALTRGEAVAIASDSKLRTIRTFKGFLVNCYQPVQTKLNGKPFTVSPQEGSFSFIYDFERFLPGEETIIIGVENGENFRWIQKQQHLFPGHHPLFVCRYPQSGDLIAWLRSIQNRYLHFGDFDFEGINIYLSEYKKHLGERACFFVPEGIEEMIKQKGNRDLYNKQSHLQPEATLLTEKPVIELLEHIHRHKKVLEQEYLIVA